MNPNMTVNVNLTCHTDPGHGWLAVKRSLLIKMGILSQITPYSYQSKSGETVYLEEDADASTFMKRAEEIGLRVTMKTSYKERSPVRSYPRFQVGV